jgi:hypothetical protein
MTEEPSGQAPTDIDPQRALNVMAKTGPLYAQAKANRVLIEEMRKSIKAVLMRAAESAGHNSVAAQEREAYADVSYAEHLKGLQAAVEEEERLRWRLVTAQTAVDVWRSRSANERGMDRGAA